MTRSGKLFVIVVLILPEISCRALSQQTDTSKPACGSLKTEGIVDVY
jgi:hypothetical protein